MQTRNEMIDANLKYARAAATKYTLRAPQDSVQWQDAFSAACEALVRSAETFRPGLAPLGVWAWPSMKRDILRLRENEKRRYERETLARHDRSNSDRLADHDEFAAGMTESVEDALLLAEDCVVKAERLSRLPDGQRLGVEAVLDGRSPGQYVRLNAVSLAEKAGVRVSSKDVPKKQRLTGAERWRRYWSRLSLEERRAQDRARQERKNAKRASARASFAEAA